MRGRATGVALPALAVLGLVAVVAIAAGGTLGSGSNLSRPPSHSLLDAVFTLLLVALVLGAVLMLYGLMQRKEVARHYAAGKHRRRTIVAYAVYFATVLAFAYWRGTHLNLRPDGAKGSGGGQVGQTLYPGTQASSSYRPGISWLSIVVVLALVGIGLAAYLNAERRARRAQPRQPDLVEQLAEVLDEALDDLRAEADPRRAVIAAYARTERVLAANGIRRRDSETPEEYLVRALDGLPPSASAVTRLTELYTWAKFSQHEVDRAMKDEAIAALEEVRDELRSEVDRPSESRSSGTSPAGVAS